eukprot:TRINITY_DN19130_c0_g1_i1.p1 TRINITY_DN19130_c0_g1~~TRINITY_DN19130_c0_g1_i1.p1  ORF type:complete len:101 (+),score=17.53 TRINITY_DN19130_c0_g1_i1:278-580(+)
MLQRALKLCYASPDRLATTVEVAFSSARIASRLVSEPSLRQPNAALSADIRRITSKYATILRTPAAARLKRVFEEVIEYSTCPVPVAVVKSSQSRKRAKP